MDSCWWQVWDLCQCCTTTRHSLREAEVPGQFSIPWLGARTQPHVVPPAQGRVGCPFDKLCPSKLYNTPYLANHWQRRCNRRKCLMAWMHHDILVRKLEQGRMALDVPWGGERLLTPASWSEDGSPPACTNHSWAQRGNRGPQRTALACSGLVSNPAEISFVSSAQGNVVRGHLNRFAIRKSLKCQLKPLLGGIFINLISLKFHNKKTEEGRAEIKWFCTDVSKHKYYWIKITCFEITFISLIAINLCGQNSVLFVA